MMLSISSGIVLSGASMLITLVLGDHGAGKLRCADAGTFATSGSTEHMPGGKMYCRYPTRNNQTAGKRFPLLSFEHGDTQGGFVLPVTYGPFLEALASSGFVVCAPLSCLIQCREHQHIHQMNAIVAAKRLGQRGVLPVRLDAKVGVLGHSTGGMTTLKCADKDNVAKYDIGAAVVYNGDGPPSWIARMDHVNFTNIQPSLPIFMVTGTGDHIEPRGSTRKNTDAILKANPGQPLLMAEIDGEGHLDCLNFPIVHPAPLKALPYIIAFLGHALEPSEDCAAEYNHTLGGQLQMHASTIYNHFPFNGTLSRHTRSQKQNASVPEMIIV
jgi:hypothetical protein